MSEPTRRPLRIGMVCYPTTGGSGIVAVELAHQLADRGHEVHVISYAMPMRLDTLQRNIRFHTVSVPSYPLFEYPPYSLALAAQAGEAICEHQLDLLHVHYAIPHAISGWLARQISGKEDVPVITTLHGTDITIVGNDPSYLAVTRFSLEACDKVTVVSQYLRDKVQEVIRCQRNTHVIHNFVDGQQYKPGKTCLRERLGIDEETPLLLHMSNFRPVKRSMDVVETFLKVRQELPAKLLMIGDGPDRVACETRLKRSPFSEDAVFLGPQFEAERILPSADLFLFPSNAESFGLAALEAQACGVPVIGYRVGGLPEVVEEGETGLLYEVGDVEAMARGAVELLRDRPRHGRMGTASRERALKLFAPRGIVQQYEDLYWQAILERLQRESETLPGTIEPPCDYYD